MDLHTAALSLLRGLLAQQESIADHASRKTEASWGRPARTPRAGCWSVGAGRLLHLLLNDQFGARVGAAHRGRDPREAVDAAKVRLRAGLTWPSPSLDLVLSRLSSAADHSKLWFAVAAALALTPAGRGGPPWLGWRASGVASATANLGQPRGQGAAPAGPSRPGRAELDVVPLRPLRRPGRRAARRLCSPAACAALAANSGGGWLAALSSGRRLLDRGHPLAAAPALGLLGGVTMSGSAGTATSMTLAS
jgi:hypothetical protein